MSEPQQPKADELDLRLPGGRSVPADQVEWRASTSGGPGGQHANRTASRVEVVVQIDALPLTPHEKSRLYEQLAARITGAGEITVGAADERSQHRNRRIALRRMERLLADALRPPRRRIPTRESYGVKLRNAQSKQHLSRRKSSRSQRWDEHDE